MSTDKDADKYLEALERSVAEGKRFTQDSLGGAPKTSSAGHSPSDSTQAPVRGTQPTRSHPAILQSSSSSTGTPPVGGGSHASTAPGGVRRQQRGRIDLADSWQEGDVLLLDDGSVGIFKDRVPNKEYQLVYFLEPDGHLKPQGVVLAAYDVRQLGRLPEEALQAFKRSQRWNRDCVVFHLHDWNDVGQLPPAIYFNADQAPRVGNVDPHHGNAGGAPGDVQPEAETQPAPMFPKSRSVETQLSPGRRFSIKFGANDWHAVYWGRDELGDVVVHNTNKQWAMMHLNISRFKDTLELGDLLTIQEMQEIRSHLEAQA